MKDNSYKDARDIQKFVQEAHRKKAAEDKVRKMEEKASSIDGAISGRKKLEDDISKDLKRQNNYLSIILGILIIPLSCGFIWSVYNLYSETRFSPEKVWGLPEVKEVEKSKAPEFVENVLASARRGESIQPYFKMGVPPPWINSGSTVVKEICGRKYVLKDPIVDTEKRGSNALITVECASDTMTAVFYIEVQQDRIQILKISRTDSVRL